MFTSRDQVGMNRNKYFIKLLMDLNERLTNTNGIHKEREQILCYSIVK